MKFITSLSLIFIFCFCIGIDLSNAQTIQDTPIMAKYRKYYGMNKRNLNRVYRFFYNECWEKCTENDLQAINKKAELGDMFALSVRDIIYPFSRKKPTESVADLDLNYTDKFYKEAADKGEPYSAARYCMVNIKNSDLKIPEKYCQFAKSKGEWLGYLGLTLLYSMNNMIPEFCNSMNESYKAFGLSAIFGGQKDKFFANCTKAKEDVVLEKAGDEGKLIKGFQLIRSKHYEEAYKLFSSIYKTGDASKISANAGYCLGAMSYLGKGVPQNKTAGKKLLKEAWDAGVVAGTPPQDVDEKPLPYQDVLPDKEIIFNPISPCNDMDK